MKRLLLLLLAPLLLCAVCGCRGKPVTLPDADTLWDALNEDNKVSLYANIGGDVKLYNKNLGD